MRPTLSLIRREFTAYFLSPIAYVVLTVFLLGTGYLYKNTFNALTTTGPEGVEYPMEAILGSTSSTMEIPTFWLVFLFIPPLLTMRLFAEERGTGTLEMLLTAPVKDWQIVFAKFVACFAFYLLMWLPTILYLPTVMDLHAQWDLHAWTLYSGVYVAGIALAALGVVVMPAGFVGRGFVVVLLGALLAIVGGWLHYTKDQAHVVWITAGIDPWPVLTAYIGIAAVGAMFLALGLFISSLVKGQMIAALLSIALGVPLIMSVSLLGELDPSGWAYPIVAFVAVPHHFAHDFTRGVLDTRHLVFYLTSTLLLLFLTVRSVESQRH